jgi:hypothetical protein
VDIVTFFYNKTVLIKGSPVHVAPACAGSGEGSDHFRSGEGSDHFESYICNHLSLYFYKRLFLGLEPMRS